MSATTKSDITDLISIALIALSSIALFFNIVILLVSGTVSGPIDPIFYKALHVLPWLLVSLLTGTILHILPDK